MKKGIAIFWFRNDLRLTDNPGLLSALEYESILPIYILDEVNPEDHHMGQASKWWLNQSLQHLNQGLDNAMSFYSGDPQLILNDLIKRFDVSAVFGIDVMSLGRLKEIKPSNLICNHGIFMLPVLMHHYCGSRGLFKK